MIHRFVDLPTTIPVLAMVSYTIQNDDAGGREEIWRVSQSPGQDPQLLTAEDETLLDDILNSIQRPDATTVVFADSDSSFATTLERIKADGTGRAVIMSNAGGEVMDVPFWHPTDNSVIFIEGVNGRPLQGRIVSINVSGSGYTIIDEIADDPTHPGWWRPQYNHDGTLIAATRRSTTSDQLYVMDADGSNQVLVSNGDFGFRGFGSQYGWANNSNVLVFADDTNGGIWKVNADGTGLTQLGSGGTASGYFVGKFCWLADDSAIIATGASNNIYSYPAAGGAESLLESTAPALGASDPPLIFGSRVYYWNSTATAFVSINLDGSEWRTEHTLSANQSVSQQEGMEAG